MMKCQPFAAILVIGVAVAPMVANAQSAPTPTTGSSACALVTQAAADGLNARIAANNASVQAPSPVSKLSCLGNFFNGTGLNVVTNLLNPGSLLTAVEGQICTQVAQAWRSELGALQCGLTITGFNTGFNLGLGSGTLCPKLSFGGGGPPIGSIGVGAIGNSFGLYMNGEPTVPTGYPIPVSGGLY